MLALVLVGEVACRILFPLDDRSAAEDLVVPKPEGTFRVVAVGGSSVAGLPIRDFGFVKQLESLLLSQRPDATLEVVNFGKGARSSTSVRTVVEETADCQADLFVVYTGHNEFLFRSGSGGTKEDVLKALRSSALYRTGNKALKKLRGPRTDAEYLLPKQLRPYERDGEWWAGREAAFYENLDAIIEATAGRGTPLILGTVVSNDADWPPVHEGVAWALENPSYDDDVARIGALVDGGDFEDALRELDSVLATWGDDAMMHYLAGQALAGLERFDQAREHFHLAREMDPYPWRVQPAFNEHLRGLGAREGVTLIDFEELFHQHAPNGLVGATLVSDNCHPTPLGSALIANALAEAMRERGWFLDPGQELPAPEEALDAFYATFGDERLRQLRVSYYLDNGVYSMKTPFRNYDAARRYFEEGIELAPDDWRLWANFGALSLLDGERDRALEQLRRARELKGAPLDGEADRVEVPYLLEATYRAGVDLTRLADA